MIKFVVVVVAVIHSTPQERIISGHCICRRTFYILVLFNSFFSDCLHLKKKVFFCYCFFSFSLSFVMRRWLFTRQLMNGKTILSSNTRILAFWTLSTYGWREVIKILAIPYRIVCVCDKAITYHRELDIPIFFSHYMPSNKDANKQMSCRWMNNDLRGCFVFGNVMLKIKAYINRWH